jgi:hypothetical protein
VGPRADVPGDSVGCVAEANGAGAARVQAAALQSGARAGWRG